VQKSARGRTRSVVDFFVSGLAEGNPMNIWQRFGGGCVVVIAFSVAYRPVAAITIDTVPIGNPGNPADTRYDPMGFGSVAYHFRIGKYEVTNAQYVEFLNGVDQTGTNSLALYDTNMTSDPNGGIDFNAGAANGSKYEIKAGRDNNPLVWVTWYSAVRFANWLHNGMGSSETEKGAYTLLGGTPTPSNSGSITRNPGAKWWLPSEDEWYKAAYHKNDGVTGNYWESHLDRQRALQRPAARQRCADAIKHRQLSKR
jgi:formylglycine-generating enzyme required for sulfatase activity